MFLPLLKVLIALMRPIVPMGNQILHAHAGIVEFFGYVDHEA